MDKLIGRSPVVVTRKFTGNPNVPENVEGEVIDRVVITLIVSVCVDPFPNPAPFEATRVTG
jgi:hypothetical protein